MDCICSSTSPAQSAGSGAVESNAKGNEGRDVSSASAPRGSTTLADAPRSDSTRQLARARIDPLEERRRDQITVPTFKAAAIEVHTNLSATFRNAKHKAQWLTSLERNIFPALGKSPVNAITIADLLKALQPIWTKRPRNRAPDQAAHQDHIRWAKASGHYSGDNPTDGPSFLWSSSPRKPMRHDRCPHP